jgi:hypothetical protein
MPGAARAKWPSRGRYGLCRRTSPLRWPCGAATSSVYGLQEKKEWRGQVVWCGGDHGCVSIEE